MRDMFLTGVNEKLHRAGDTSITYISVRTLYRKSLLIATRQIYLPLTQSLPPIRSLERQRVSILLRHQVSREAPRLYIGSSRRRHACSVQCALRKLIEKGLFLCGSEAT